MSCKKQATDFVKTLDKAIKACDAGPTIAYEVIMDGKKLGTVGVYKQAIDAAVSYAKKNNKKVTIREIPTGKTWFAYPDGSVRW